MNPRLKQIIFNKLYKDLSHVEIIPHKDSVWFIDRNEKYWYFEYKKNGTLYWRWKYFTNFFELFSLKEYDFEPIISEWVEEVLNCKVVTPCESQQGGQCWVEEVLNCKVVTPFQMRFVHVFQVEEVLNCKVNTPLLNIQHTYTKVEEVLNCKVVTPTIQIYSVQHLVEKVLNSK